MRLTPEQENIICQYVERHKLSLPSLSEDLIDHLCCVVEIRLGKGLPFEESFAMAKEDLAPDGLHEIEHQTIFLLNYKRIIIMKKLTYIIGFIGTVVLAMGISANILLIPIAGKLFMAGLLTLLLVFMPMLAFDRYKLELTRHSSYKFKIILSIVAAIIIGAAGLFRLMHWPGAAILMALGTLVFAFGFLPFLFFTMYKSSVEKG